MTPDEAAVLIPYRPDGGWRDRAFDYVRALWVEGGFAVEVGEDPGPGPFNKSAAANRAWRQAERRSPRAVIVADADTVVSADQALAAAELACRRGGLVVAHDQWVSLRRVATEQIYQGRLPAERWPAAARWVKRNGPGSCVAVPADLWARTGGMDERFRGWGFEDRAFLEAADRLGDAPATRMPGAVFHLWHPRSPDKNPGLATYQANQALRDRYWAASTAEAMLALLSEPGGPLG